MTPDSFLHETRKHYEVFKALFLWSRGHCMKQVLQETKFGRDTLRKLFSNWRKLVLCDSVDKLVGLVESDEMAIGRRKFNRGKRSRSTGVQCSCWMTGLLPLCAEISVKTLRKGAMYRRTGGRLTWIFHVILFTRVSTIKSRLLERKGLTMYIRTR